jgi:DNA polymerase IV
MPAALASIVHLDADAFFVSCELARLPELRGRKVAVGGRERGIISSASYEARAAGVYTPMPTARALRVCPELILLEHTRGLYGATSQRMFDLCETLTPHVERASIDEGYLDLGPCGLADTTALVAAVRGLQQRIWTELQVPVSFGLARNKLVAQIASKLRKPRGFVVVPPGEEAAFLAPLPVGKLPGVGAKTETILRAQGLASVADVLAAPEHQLAALLGTGWREFRAAARGEDERPVETEADEAKSHSQQETFAEDIADFAAIAQVAKRMVDELLPTLRADGLRARTLTLKVRYPDFTQASAARSLPEASDLEGAFYSLLEPLLRQAWARQERPLRLVAVRFSALERGVGQLGLFATEDEKRRRLASVVDKLNASPATRARITRGHQL